VKHIDATLVTGSFTRTPEMATDADKRHHGWQGRHLFWTPENRAKVDPYLREYGGVVDAIVKRVRRRFPNADRDTLYSEGMYALARSATSYKPGRSKFTTYAIPPVYRIVRDAAVRMLREKQAAPKVDSIDSPHAPPVAGGTGDVLAFLADAEDRTEAVAWVRRCIQGFSDRDQLIFRLLFWEGVNRRDIGKDPRVGMSRQGVCQAIDRRMDEMTVAWQCRRAG
jgi:RNA polymerase sigma factor (sigma-70 family)